MSKKGLFGDILFKIRLTIRLMTDQRVAFYLKLIPVIALVYLVVPFDLLIGPIDDAVLIMGAVQMFVSLCPQDVVEEHTDYLRNRKSPQSSQTVQFLEEDAPDKK